MRALVASDLHGNHVAYEWLAKIARNRSAGIVILTGDLLGCSDEYDSVEAAQLQDAAAIVPILEATEIPIYYIMGNDDFVDLNPSSDQFTSIHGQRFEIGQFNLVGYQYSLPFMGGVFEKREEEIREDLVHISPSVDNKTILVTHSPAYGVLDTGILGIHAGSHAILELINRREVRAHIHGHIHECFGRWARHFNVAAGGQCRAMLIDLESLHSSVEQEHVGGA